MGEDGKLSLSSIGVKPGEVCTAYSRAELECGAGVGGAVGHPSPAAIFWASARFIN